MSNLQIGLAIAGGVLLAGVVAQGAWSSRRNAPRQAKPEAHLGNEPAFAGTEPTTVDSEFDPNRFPLPAAVRKPVMDSLIDVIATIALDAPTTAISGEAALAAMPVTRRAGSKPFSIEGYNLASLVWENPLAGQRYGGFQAGVQWVSRYGSLNEIEYSE